MLLRTHQNGWIENDRQLNCWQACGATRTLMHCCLEDKIHNHSEILYTVPYKVKYTSTQRRIKLEELHHTISRLTRTLGIE